MRNEFNFHYQKIIVQGLILRNVRYLVFITPLAFRGWKLGLAALASLALTDAIILKGG